MAKYETIMSAGSKDSLQNMINGYLFSENYIITDDLKIYNTKTKKFLDYQITCKSGRYSMKRAV